MPSRLILFLIFITTLISPLLTQNEEHRFYFYRPENTFGSDANFSPWSLLINGSYDIYRNGGYRRKIWETPYDAGFSNVWYNIRDPFPRIRAFGTEEFISSEIINFKWNTKHAEFVPNFSDHVIGNGMEYAKLTEYLEYRDIPYPHFWAALTTTAYQVLNEVIESGPDPRYVYVDMIADMYIYNTAGLILFSTEFGKRFFSETVPTFGWSPQPIYEPVSRRLQNAGQNYVIRKNFSWLGNFSPMMYWGIYGMLGVSYKTSNNESYSFTFGQVVNKLQSIRERGFRKINPNLDMAAGFFYDRNNSLMFSTLITGPGMYNVQFNLYPGLVTLGEFAPAFYLGYGEWDKLVFGMTFSITPVGIGYGK